MPVPDQDFATSSRRVADLAASEATLGRSIEFIARTLAQMKEVQDTQTKGLQRVEADVKGLRNDMPGIVAAAMREVGSKPKRKSKA